MTSLKMLVDTIGHVVTAPYVVDIAPLYTVIRHVGDDTIRIWCLLKFCQIPKLVLYLLRFLCEERGVEVFERLSRSVVFAKTAAQNYPELLPQMLDQAIGEAANSTTNRLCLKLLATQPLQTSGIPAELPPYLEKLMRTIHESPTADLLHAFCEIIAQRSARILELATQDVLVDFIQTCKLLTKDVTSNCHEAAIVGLNIDSAVYEEVSFRALGYPGTVNPEGSGALCEWARKVLDNFDGLKVPRTLHSIVARVMFFTSKNQSIPMSTRVRTLDIIGEILNRFKCDVKKWSAENYNAVDKVWRNTAGDNLDFDARLSAFAVAIKITPDGTYLESIESVLSQLVPKIVSEDHPGAFYLTDKVTVKAKLLIESLCFLVQSHHQPCIELLSKAVQFILARCSAFQHPCPDTYTKIQNALILLQALSESVERYQEVFLVILSVLDENDCMEWTSGSQNLSGNGYHVLEANCREDLVCVQSLLGLRVQLCSRFSAILLRGACTTPSIISTKHFVLLLETVRSYTPNAEKETCRYPVYAGFLRLQPSPPTLPPGLGDWRQQLMGIMSDHQQQSAEAVFEHISNVCKDFEQRCDTIELPLRLAKSETARLQVELDLLKSALREAETSNTATMQALRDADDVIRQKDIKINALKHEVNELLGCIAIQNDKLTEQAAETLALKEDHAKKLSNLHAEAIDTKLDLERLNKADRFAFEEQIEDEKQKVVNLAATVTWLESEMHNMQEEHKAESQIQAKLEQAYNEVMKQVEHLRIELVGREQDVGDFKKVIDNHEAKLCEHRSRIDDYVRNERTLLQERSQLQERLRAADVKQKKVLATLQGLDTNSQASLGTSLEPCNKRQVLPRTALEEED